MDFTDDERKVIREAYQEAEVVRVRHERLVQALKETERDLIAKTGGLQQVVRAVLKLHHLNPDAYEVTLDNGEVSVRPTGQPAPAKPARPRLAK